MTARQLIAINAGTWAHGRDGPDETVRAFEALAAGTLSGDRLESWVGHRMYDGA